MLPDPRQKGYVIGFESQKQTKLREAMIRKKLALNKNLKIHKWLQD